jgi:hypothetical protein
MKSRSEIWFAILAEAGFACSVSTTRDSETVKSRLAAEGDSFFTIALPAFEKDFLRSLEEGRIPIDAFVGFKRRKPAGAPKGIKGIPEFLGGFLDLLFTSEKGQFVEGQVVRTWTTDPILRPYDHTDFSACARARIAVRTIRQLCLFFSKEKAVSETDKVKKAIAEYVQTDEKVTLPLAISGVPSFLKGGSSRTPGEFYAPFLDRHYPL